MCRWGRGVRVLYRTYCLYMCMWRYPHITHKCGCGGPGAMHLPPAGGGGGGGRTLAARIQDAVRLCAWAGPGWHWQLGQREAAASAGVVVVRPTPQKRDGEIRALWRISQVRTKKGGVCYYREPEPRPSLRSRGAAGVLCTRNLSGQHRSTRHRGGRANTVLDCLPRSATSRLVAATATADW